MLFAGVNSSFALSDTLQMNVPEFITAEVDSSSVLSGTLSYKSSDTVTIDSPLSIKFNVASNISYSICYGFADCGNTTGLYGSVPIANNQTQDINLSSGKIVFTKANGTTTAAAVDNALSNSPSAVDNANAIAFPISCTESNYSDVWLMLDVTGYQIDGEKQLTCTINGDSISGTYGQNDASGNYISNIVLTRLYNSD